MATLFRTTGSLHKQGRYSLVAIVPRHMAAALGWDNGTILLWNMNTKKQELTIRKRE